jgi:hypothetical protein
VEDKAADFLVDLLAFIPDDAVFGCSVDEELAAYMAVAGYPEHQSRGTEIPLTEKQLLTNLIQNRRLHWRTDHLDIMLGQEYLLQAYDHMMHTWLSIKVDVSQEFIEQYGLELRVNTGFWTVGEFPELDD